MKSRMTELVFILDRSGSMSGLESDTIGGFNSMIQRQRTQPGITNVTTVLFDDRYETIHDRIPLEHVTAMTQYEYYVRGCTALLDAIGRTIHEMSMIQKHLPRSKRAEKVIFVIITDGLENASRHYSRARVKEMIEHRKRRYGWEFLFLGANMDAVKEAGSFGIGADRSVTFQNDSIGVQMNFRVMGETLCAMRAAAPGTRMGAEWKSEIEDDFRRRGDRNFR